MCDEKKSEKIGIWVGPTLLVALARLANAEDLSLSAYLERELRRHAWGHARAVTDAPQGPDRPETGR